MNTEQKNKTGIVTAMVAAAALIGAAGGAYVNSQSQVHAQSATTAPVPQTTNSTTTAPATGGTGGSVNQSNGTFKSNEDPTHEAGESAAREAQENAGQRPTVK